jgi:hypothetical protein
LLSGGRHLRLLVVLLGVTAPLAVAQQLSIAPPNADYHLLQDSARNVYGISAFAHGHRHGYEEGFHAGDEDYHLRHVPNPTGKQSKLNGYKREYGDKKTYMHGFSIGFQAGYADSYSGQPFRSSREIAEFEIDVPHPLDPRTEKVINNYFPRIQSLTFDQGAQEGYKDGFSSSEATTYAPGLGELAGTRCEAEHQNQPAFCAGYSIGFLLGKDDIRSLRNLQQMDPAKIPPNR